MWPNPINRMIVARTRNESISLSIVCWSTRNRAWILINPVIYELKPPERTNCLGLIETTYACVRTHQWTELTPPSTDMLRHRISCGLTRPGLLTSKLNFSFGNLRCDELRDRANPFTLPRSRNNLHAVEFQFCQRDLG